MAGMLIKGGVAVTVAGVAALGLLQMRAGDVGRIAEVGQAAEPPTVSWLPERPSQGALLALVVQPASAAPADAVAGVDATIAGQPVAFTHRDDGAWSGVGGIPIDSTDHLTIPLRVHRVDGSTDSLSTTVPLAAGDYRLERLSVAPRFGRSPDAALASRQAEEAARARAVSERSLHTPRLWGAQFVRPRATRITSGFGHGRQFNGVVQSRHMGTDFAGAVGTPVRATNCGVVALVADFHLAGNAIYVDHGAGLVSGYFHLSQTSVAEGDTVAAGEVIGRVGATGRVTGPHLHWILRHGTTTVDPMSVFALAGENAAPLGEPAQPCSAVSTSSAAR